MNDFYSEQSYQEPRRPTLLTVACVLGIVSQSLSIIGGIIAAFLVGAYVLIGLPFAGFGLVLYVLVLQKKNWARITLDVLAALGLGGLVVAVFGAIYGLTVGGILKFASVPVLLGSLVALGYVIFLLIALNADDTKAWITGSCPPQPPTPPLVPEEPRPTVHENLPAKPFGVLIAEEGALRGTTSVLGHQDYVLGRSGDIVLPAGDLKVSREHAKIRFENGAYVIYDMGSTNHTRINGERVDRKLLQTGDHIAIGETVFRFEWVRK